MFLLLTSFQALCADGSAQSAGSVVTEVLHVNDKSSLITKIDWFQYLFPLLPPDCGNSGLSGLPLIFLSVAPSELSRMHSVAVSVPCPVSPASQAVRARRGLPLDAGINGTAGTPRGSK